MTTIKATCPVCGDVDLTPSDVRLTVAGVSRVGDLHLPLQRVPRQRWRSPRTKSRRIAFERRWPSIECQLKPQKAIPAQHSPTTMFSTSLCGSKRTTWLRAISVQHLAPEPELEPAAIGSFRLVGSVILRQFGVCSRHG